MKNVNQWVIKIAGLVFVMILSSVMLYAESKKTISGQVMDKQGEPLAGVTVVVKGTFKGVVTDLNGKYVIENILTSDVLQYRFVGMKTQEVVVKKEDRIINVMLETDMANLEEVIVVGYGNRKKVDLTGSVSTVSAEKLESRPLSNITQALQGQMPGVAIRQMGGGQPGREQMLIEIRGRNSFSTGTNPLVVIDGIVSNSIEDVDINAVESISVLKDAASAAIYGARAANGVILITTKKGGASGKLNVSYSGKFLYQTPYMWKERIWNSPEYMRMHNTAIDNSGSTWPKYTEEQIRAYENGPTEEYPWYNYEDEYINNVSIMVHSLSISGTNGNTNYYVGGNIWTQDGVIDHFTYDKYDIIGNFESKVNNWIRFGISSSLKVSKQTEPYCGTNTWISSLFSMRPTFAPFKKGENGEPDRFTFRRYLGPEWSMMNPEAMLRYGGITDKNKLFRFNGFIELGLLPGLKWNTRIAADYRVRDYSQLLPKITFVTWEPTEIEETMWDRNTIALKNQMEQGVSSTVMTTLNYEKSFGDHNLDVLVGFSSEDNKMKYLEGYRKDLPSLETDQISAGSVTEWSNSGNIFVDNAFNSFFGRISYNFKYKYLLEINGRYDGSSRFPKGHRFAFFPSASLAWRISEEAFIKDNVNWIDNLKIRASVGKMGNNAIGDYPYQSTISGGLNYPFNNILSIGFEKTNLANRSIKWETTDNYGVGMDVTLWGGMLDITLDGYSKRTSGILRNTQLPGYAGMGAPMVNEGIVSNKGFEFVLGHRRHFKDFDYGITFNISKNWNKLVKFGAPVLNFNLMMEGKEINRYFTYITDGLFQNEDEIATAPEQLSPKNTLKPGDIRLKDVSGPEGKPDGKITPDDRVDMNGINPDFTYGGNLYVQWKGFDFSALFQGVQGLRININDTHILPWGNGNAPLKIWRDSWTENNRDTDIPLMRSVWPSVPWHQTYNVTSSWFLQDASYFRLKNLSFGYTLPGKIFLNTFIQSLKLSASLENVFTITSFRFGDPERPSSLSFPTLRTFSFSVDIKF